MRKLLWIAAGLCALSTSLAEAKEFYVQVMPVRVTAVNSKPLTGKQKVQTCVTTLNEALTKSGVKVNTARSEETGIGYLGVVIGQYQGRYIVTVGCHEANPVAMLTVTDPTSGKPPQELIQKLLKIMSN